MLSERGVVAILCGTWIIVGTAGPVAAQGGPAAAPALSCGAGLAGTLAGAWKAPVYKMQRASEVGTQVFGPNSFDVRDVDLTLDASGSGALKISTSVLDQKGKTWAATLIEAKLTIGAAEPSKTGGCQPAVTLASAQERYLDDSQYQAPIVGAQAMLLVDASGKKIDLRFETPDGRGSFWTTLLKRPAGGH